MHHVEISISVFKFFNKTQSFANPVLHSTETYIATTYFYPRVSKSDFLVIAKERY